MPAPLARRGKFGHIVAWRTDLTQSQCGVFASFYAGGPGGIGSLPDGIRISSQKIEAIPPQPIWQIASVSLGGVYEAFGHRLRDARRRRQERILKKLQRAIFPGLDFFLRKVDKYIKTRSPAVVVGWDRPYDWPPGREESAEYYTEKATRALTALPAVWQEPERWTIDEHIRFATAALASARWSIEAGAASAFLAHADTLDWIGIRAPYDESGITRDLLRGAGLDPKDTHKLPLAGQPTAMRLDEFLHHATPQIVANVHRFVRTLPPSPKSLLLSNLYHHLAEEVMTALNEGEAPFQYAWDPQTRVLENMAHVNRWPHPDTTQAQLLAIIERGAAVLAHTEQGYMPADEMAAIIRSVGAAVITPRALAAT